MPLHDWTRVETWAWHNFQLSWLCELGDRLNNGVLPKQYFAMKETLEFRPPTRFYEMKEPENPKSRPLAEAEPPQLPERFRPIGSSSEPQYAMRMITIRDSYHYGVCSAIYVPSRQDYRTSFRKRAIVESAIGALTRDLPVLLIDLHSDTRDSSDTIAESIWRELGHSAWDRSTDAPHALVSFDFDSTPQAYLEPIRPGEPLNDFPLFLGHGNFVLMPLEATYMATWSKMPEPIRELVEATP